MAIPRVAGMKALSTCGRDDDTFHVGLRGRHSTWLEVDFSRVVGVGTFHVWLERRLFTCSWSNGISCVVGVIPFHAVRESKCGWIMNYPSVDCLRTTQVRRIERELSEWIELGLSKCGWIEYYPSVEGWRTIQVGMD